MKNTPYKYNAIYLPGKYIHGYDKSKFGFDTYSEAESYVVSNMCFKCKEEYYKPNGYSPCDVDWKIVKVKK